MGLIQFILELVTTGLTVHTNREEVYHYDYKRYETGGGSIEAIQKGVNNEATKMYILKEEEMVSFYSYVVSVVKQGGYVTSGGRYSPEFEVLMGKKPE